VRSTTWTPVAPSVSPSAVVTLVAVQLRLRAGADPGALSSWADRLRPELDRSPDLVGYALQVAGDGLQVVSAWSRRASLATFERGPLHTAAQRALRPLLHPPVIDVWRGVPGDLPPAWDDVHRRLKAADQRTRSRLGGP
jgi:hypothetical protein